MLRTIFVTTGRCFNSYLEDGETLCLPSERESKIIIRPVEFDSVDELEPEISWIKGSPGKQTGGPPAQSTCGASSGREMGGTKHSPPDLTRISSNGT